MPFVVRIICSRMMVIFGFVEASSGDMRASVLALITFFVLGFIALLFVPKNEKEKITQPE